MMVKRKAWHGSYKEALCNVDVNNHIASIFLDSCEHTDEYFGVSVPRNGDALVGFLADADCSFDLYISDNCFCRHELKAGEFGYAVERAIVPLICWIYYKVALVNLVGKAPSLVFAVFNSDYRKVVAVQGAYARLNSDEIILYKGTIGRMRTKDVGDAIELLPLDH